MIRKIVLIVLIVFGLIGSVNAYESNLKLPVKVKDGATPVSNIGVIYSIGGTETKSKLTDKNGNVTVDFTYNSESTNNIIFILNGNQLTVNEFNDQVKSIEIDYNQQTQSIISGVAGDLKVTIYNQQIKTNTNYKLLIIYSFFTILITTILLGGRYIYNILYRDIYKHKV